MTDKGQIAGGLLDGLLAFDNAVSLEAAAMKNITSEVAGRADVLVAPDRLQSINTRAELPVRPSPFACCGEKRSLFGALGNLATSH